MAEAVIVADPIPAPVTWGCVDSCVAPAGMTTLAGDTVTLEMSLDDRLTVRPPVGAAVPKVIANGADCPNPVVIAGTVMAPEPMTVTEALVSATYGKRLAWMVATPGATAVTTTVTLLDPGPKVTVCGTVAAAGLSEVKSNVRPPAGAGAALPSGALRLKARPCCPTPVWTVVLKG